MDGEQPACHVALSALHRFCCDGLQTVGVPEAAATLVADSLTQADARGLASHGVVRLLPVYIRRLQARTMRASPRMQVVRERGAVATIDGDAGLGQVVGRHAMDMAISAVRRMGVGVVGVRNSSHFGYGAFFVEQAIAADMIGLVTTNAPSNMPPWGGRQPYFGTNPLTVGIPCGSEWPVVLDMSTSVVARGKIIIAHKEGRSIPPGWAIDAEGRPTEDAEAALQGAVLPVGGYKGSGLALVIDALSGVLTGAAFGSHIVNLYDEGPGIQNVGHFFVALDVESFMPVGRFKARMDRFVQEVRSQPRLPGVERIFVPGEIEYEQAERSAQLGVPMASAGMKELDELAGRLGIPSLSQRIRAAAR